MEYVIGYLVVLFGGTLLSVYVEAEILPDREKKRMDKLVAREMKKRGHK